MRLSTSDAQAKEVSCPKCKAKKNEPCTYITDQVKWEKIKDYTRNYNSRTYYSSGPNFARITSHKKGDECKSVHNERRNKAWNKRIKALRMEAPAPPPSALQSLNAFDQREYEQLREWLRFNAYILWSLAGTLEANPQDSDTKKKRK